MGRLTIITFAGMLAGAAPARGDFPAPEASQVDPCIVTCPSGDSVFAVIARQPNGNPWPYGETEVHLCGCPDVVLAPVESGGPYRIDACRVSAPTWPHGVSAFPLESGGVCSGASIAIYCDGLLMGIRSAVASFDQDGDLVVSEGDLAIVGGKQGTGDPTADFDCDDMVTAADLDIAAGHAGHYHASLVGVGDTRGLDFAVRPVPNPSRGPVDFVLRAPAGGRAVLAIFDPAGRRVASVFDHEVEAGTRGLHWSGRDAAGQQVRNGLYFYRLTLGALSARGAVVVAR